MMLTCARTGLAVPPTPSITTQIQYLSGHGRDDAVPWDFDCTGGRRSGFWTTIPVPSCWELQGFGTYQYGLVARNRKSGVPIADEQGKYRLQFTVPAAWAGRTVRLVFEGSMTDTEAWVNGHVAGPVHQGAFYQFSYDITRLLNYDGPNVLQVTVSKESANPSVNAAERRGDYWNFGGIFRPVYLEAFPPQYIARTAIDARADGDFTADIYLAGQRPGPARVVGQVEQLDGVPVGKPFAADVPVGAGEVTLNSKLSGIRLWTAETPKLYQVRFTLSEVAPDLRAGAGPDRSRSESPQAVGPLGERARPAQLVPQHTVTVQFGFRTFEVRPGVGLFLNGHKIVLKGIDRHSFWPDSGRTLSPAINREDVRLIKEMNMNAVRMSHYPPDADFLKDCDRLGLYVLDELAGWHGCYDTPTGRKLIGEMVRRDVNHPSVLFWDNGNETGWNAQNDDQFDRWDIQHRPVLHPIGIFSGVDTMHYRSYAETVARCAGPNIFMPTEFLHGLYDGGLGAGLDDYWKVMSRSPRCAGGLMWAFLDEGVVRTDENDRIDNAGDFAPDGIVGPYREKEGSFYTVRQIWSPVQVHAAPPAGGQGTPAGVAPARPAFYEALPAGFAGRLTVANDYDFLNLDQCRFDWALARFPAPDVGRAGHTVIAGGEVRGPDVAPHGTGELTLPLPANWRDADVLYVTARDPEGRSLWTWSWTWRTNAQLRHAAAPAAKLPAAEGRDDGIQIGVLAGRVDYRFDKATGELAEVLLDGRPISLDHGPRFVAARRADRNPDGTVRAHVAKGVDRQYLDVAGKSTLTHLTFHSDGADVVVEADYSGPLRRALWRISPDGDARLDYTYAYHGAVDLMGIAFDYPRSDMKSIRWLGMGPYRVYQNRMKGTTLDVWQNFYHVNLRGETYDYPEFNGYFRDWRWAEFGTSQGQITLGNDHAGRFLGVYEPTPARVDPLAVFPPTGLAVLDVIPAMRSKVYPSDDLGPESQVQHVDGVYHGTIHFHFSPAAPGAH